LDDPNNALAEASDETALFVLLEQLPVGKIIVTLSAIVAVIVVVLFFATSSDSGSLVFDILSNGGVPNPRWQQRLFWAILEGVVADVLVIASAAAGEVALTAVQTASFTAGFPFWLVFIAMCVGLVRGFCTEAVDPPRAPEPVSLAGVRLSFQHRHAATSSSEYTS